MFLKTLPFSLFLRQTVNTAWARHTGESWAELGHYLSRKHTNVSVQVTSDLAETLAVPSPVLRRPLQSQDTLPLIFFLYWTPRPDCFWNGFGLLSETPPADTPPPTGVVMPCRGGFQGRVQETQAWGVALHGASDQVRDTSSPCSFCAGYQIYFTVVNRRVYHFGNEELGVLEYIQHVVRPSPLPIPQASYHLQQKLCARAPPPPPFPPPPRNHHIFVSGNLTTLHTSYSGITSHSSCCVWLASQAWRLNGSSLSSERLE